MKNRMTWTTAIAASTLLSNAGVVDAAERDTCAYKRLNEARKLVACVLKTSSKEQFLGSQTQSAIRLKCEQKYAAKLEKIGASSKCSDAGSNFPTETRIQVGLAAAAVCRHEIFDACW